METTAQNILDALEATILKLASGTDQSVSFNGQTFTKKDMKALTDQRAYWKGEVLREQETALATPNANSGGRIPIRFVSS